ncbi:alkyl sulfatase BDS1-like metallo-beta-lactamase superfamily hydrolase [Haloactinopolyspora alba]|uniref:Linear primary-alkylsulfatase n=1 Tax=Haloactinopolyspora alba TaxID=648780 RepID=A0A2P8E009_9ACTN|nr:alkyl sulfatase dimerization domain-containing protein [Haloactinopolyspora alba]PSL02813.1 alkyl sulfatase BDS1-like metallo-beta-lactamase superfamily hydrolase [Haloactinopolyspora alba]
MSDRKPATSATTVANARILETLPFADGTDVENARRGLISESTGKITNADGQVVWDLDRWNFLDGAAPDTANPSLWRQGRLASIAGVFEVTEGVYQVRGYDLSVTSFLRTDSGWIVVDPLLTLETMEAAFAAVKEHVDDRPVVGVIYTHSHVDHFGGVRAVVSDDDVTSGRVRIVAPVDFMTEAISENVMLGNAMSRRSSYMYGNLVGWDPRGGLGAGLGQLTSSGTITLVPPTDIVSETGQELTIDGLRIQFQHTPGAEAPAELCFYLPAFKALCMAEIATHTLHNVYTLRGAKIRDSLAWSRHINDAVRLWCDDASVVFSSHHWPTWGNANIVRFMKGQRDLYRYLHDETLRLANHGYNHTEIAEILELPDGIAESFANRGYYGSVNHNVKAIYVYYLGWFDGNPANLHPLPPVETARKTVEYMGGTEAVLAKARHDYDNGEYRWVAQAVNHVVFADPDNDDAKQLQADTLEQLGYQAESGPWRDFYLSGAKELRDGVTVAPTPTTVSADTVTAMTTEMLLDYLGVRLNGPKAAHKEWAFNLNLTGPDEKYVLEVGNGVLNYTRDTIVNAPTATISCARSAIDAVLLGRTTLADQVGSGAITVDGDRDAFTEFLGLLDEFDFWFDIVTP